MMIKDLGYDSLVTIIPLIDGWSTCVVSGEMEVEQGKAKIRNDESILNPHLRVLQP